MTRLAKQTASILLPAITTVVTMAIESASVDKPAFQRAKANILTGKYETDRLEQYTRRENIRINGFLVDDQDLTKCVVTLLNDIQQAAVANGQANPDNITFKEEDISVCHKIGKRTGHVDKRQIIVRFVSRQKTLRVFRIKKYVKNIEKYKDVYITDDLTKLRLKLKDYLRKQDTIAKVYTIDGNIHCEKTDGQHFTVASPGYLFKMDIEVDLK